MSNSHPDSSLGFQNISDLFSLETHHFDEAQRLSQQCTHSNRQWHLYGQTLATLAFEEWLDYRAPALTINTQENLIGQPEYANLIDAVVHLQVGSFKVCLLPNLCMSDPEVLLPKAVVDIPELAAHLYVVVGIDEESELAGVQGFLRHDQINTLWHEHTPHPADLKHNYTLLITEFNSDANELLLNLDCLAPTMIPLPEIPVVREIALDNIRTEIEALLSKNYWKSFDCPFSWDQLVAILTHSDLRKWVYQYCPQDSNSSFILNSIPETITNIKYWLDGEIEDLKSGLKWSYLNSLRTGMRLNSEISLTDILNEIEKSKELKIPSTAKLTYNDIPFSSFIEKKENNENQSECSEITSFPNIRLYGVTWFSELKQTWDLLIILGSPPGQPPPHGVSLLVSQQSEILLDKKLKQPDAYLYVQITGEVNEVFTVAIMPELADIDIKFLFTFSSN